VVLLVLDKRTRTHLHSELSGCNQKLTPNPEGGQDRVGCLQAAVLYSTFISFRSAMSLAAGVLGEGVVRSVGRLKPL